MLVAPFLMVTEVKLLQPENPLIISTPPPMIIDVKPVQFIKASRHMRVTLSGIVTEVKLLHLKNAPSPMFVTLFGMVTEVKPVQPEKAQ